MPRVAVTLLVSLVCVNLFDIAIHAAFGLLEPVRVATNIVVIAVAVILLATRGSARMRSGRRPASSVLRPRGALALVALLVYSILNVWFFAQNPIGVLGVILVTLTIALLVWLLFVLSRMPKQPTA